jgi:hypothetical protein
MNSRCVNQRFLKLLSHYFRSLAIDSFVPTLSPSRVYPIHLARCPEAPFDERKPINNLKDVTKLYARSVSALHPEYQKYRCDPIPDSIGYRKILEF